MEKPWFAACFIYVLFKRDELPVLVGELAFGKYDKFVDFRTAVVDVVEKKGSFRNYERFQLAGGFFFKLTHPAEGNRPARPEGNGLVPRSVELSPGDCILLDISASEFRCPFVPRAFRPCRSLLSPFRPAPYLTRLRTPASRPRPIPAGEPLAVVGVSDVAKIACDAAADAAVKFFTKMWKAQDAHTFLPPTGEEYERLADNHVDAWLLGFCGLRIVPGARRRLADTDPEAQGQQWVARFLVTVEPALHQPPRNASFFVYGGSDYHPPAQLQLRELSPHSPKAHFFAVFEYTAYDEWFTASTSEEGTEQKNLLSSLEQRLAILQQRAGAAGSVIADICDVVAVVGVAGQYPCEADVELILSDPAVTKYPLLKAMFNAHRFVFFQFFAVAAAPQVVASFAGAVSAAPAAVSRHRGAATSGAAAASAGAMSGPAGSGRRGRGGRREGTGGGRGGRGRRQ